MSENILKPEVKKVTHQDLGVSEDEFNNFLIDCHSMMKSKPNSPNPYKETDSIASIAVENGAVVKVTITKTNYPLK